MSHSEELSQWAAEVASHLPGLSRRQAWVLALYSFGMVLARGSGLSTISDLLGRLFDRQPNSMRSQLREWCYEAEAKRGRQRQAVCVSDHFAALLGWVLARWQGPRQLVLVMDATTLGQRFAVLAISVVYRGSAIPVAWKVVGQSAPGSWRAHWLDLLAALDGAVPTDWMVLVLTDRGLYAKWLYQAIVKRGWHPLMRINACGQFKRPRQRHWQPLAKLLRPGMGVWCHRVVCFKSQPSQLAVTLLAQWDATYAQGCLVISDLMPSQLLSHWYNLRVWIERGFKELKRGGWHWEHTKMSHPQRVERLWFVMAVASLWVLRLGTDSLADHELWSTHSSSLSRFRRGLNIFLVRLLRHQPVGTGYLAPANWYDLPFVPLKTYP